MRPPVSARSSTRESALVRSHSSPRVLPPHTLMWSRLGSGVQPLASYLPGCCLLSLLSSLQASIAPTSYLWRGWLWIRWLLESRGKRPWSRPKRRRQWWPRRKRTQGCCGKTSWPTSLHCQLRHSHWKARPSHRMRRARRRRRRKRHTRRVHRRSSPVLKQRSPRTPVPKVAGQVSWCVGYPGGRTHEALPETSLVCPPSVRCTVRARPPLW